MHFSGNKTPIEVTRDGAFGGTCLRDIYSSLMKNGRESHGKTWIS